MTLLAFKLLTASGSRSELLCEWPAFLVSDGGRQDSEGCQGNYLRSLRSLPQRSSEKGHVRASVVEDGMQRMNDVKMRAEFRSWPPKPASSRRCSPAQPCASSSGTQARASSGCKRVLWTAEWLLGAIREAAKGVCEHGQAAHKSAWQPACRRGMAPYTMELRGGFFSLLLCTPACTGFSSIHTCKGQPALPVPFLRLMADVQSSHVLRGPPMMRQAGLETTRFSIVAKSSSVLYGLSRCGTTDRLGVMLG